MRAPVLLLSYSFLVLMSTAGTAQTVDTFDKLVSEAAAAREQNETARAIQLYSQAIQLNPKWPDGWWFLGSLQYDVGSYAPARDAITHFLELTPNAGPATALRGLCEFETGEYPQALADIQKGISLGAASQPRNAQILRYHEGLLLTKLGRFEDALKSYAYFAENQITSPDLLLAIGLAGLRIAAFPQELTPEQRDLVANMGNAAFQHMTGDEKATRQAFEEFFRRFPTTVNAHYFYGYLLYSSDPEAAIIEFKRELELSPSNDSAQIMTAWALLMRNRPAEALGYAESAVQKKPNLQEVQLALGRALSETGKLKEGIEHLELALQIGPGNLETHIALAEAYSMSGQKEAAQRERQLCLQMTKDSTTQVASP